jgi:hypothetical protein
MRTECSKTEWQVRNGSGAVRLTCGLTLARFARTRDKESASSHCDRQRHVNIVKKVRSRKQSQSRQKHQKTCAFFPGHYHLFESPPIYASVTFLRARSTRRVGDFGVLDECSS